MSDVSVKGTGKQPAGIFYTTDGVPRQRRRTYWRDAVAHTFGAVDVKIAEEVFSGTIHASPTGRTRGVTVDSEALQTVRTPRLIAQSTGDDHVVVMLLSSGLARVEQDARDAYVEPGQLFVYDRARPMRLTFPDTFQTKALVLPRHLLSLRESDLRRITASPLDSTTPLGDLLSPFLSRLVDTAGAYPQHVGDLITRNVLDLLTVLADERRGGDTTGTPSAARVLLMRVQAYIDRHLADPDLTPEAIARANQISLRYLYKLFQSEGTTVRRWIQGRRLEQCRRELARRDAASRTIAAVGRRWGFVSAAHFSRAFRAAYGMSPVEWRYSAALERRTHTSPTGRLDVLLTAAIPATADDATVSGMPRERSWARRRALRDKTPRYESVFSKVSPPIAHPRTSP
ncbi:AraC-like ligand-binding domain-containing protein [Streptomyces olivaceoviridis]|uniref:AraC-like ligand-binding domain-containing protein n=1 Tax=Streptomyces olivaceoviridis TaxID=1921 RepID=UPI0036D0D800